MAVDRTRTGQSSSDMDASAPAPALRWHSSIRAKVLRQSVLLVTFCILLLGGLLFYVITSFVTASQLDASGAFYGLRALKFTVLFVSGMLVALAFLLSTFLASSLTGALQQLSEKVRAIRPGTWLFHRTIHTGDEIEMLDSVVADLTSRLRDAYEHLEEKVADRTRELREEFALDRAILVSIEYGVLAVDSHGVVTEANPAACQLLQRERADVLQGSASALLSFTEHGHSIPGGTHPVDLVMQKHDTYRSHPSQHLGLKRRNDEVLPVTLLIVPLFQEQRFFGAIIVLQDQSVERQIDYLKSEFISLASHQLRTPLSSIRWYIEMLSSEKGDFSADHVSWLREIDGASSRMANLIEALLHVAKLEESGLIAKKSDMDITAFLQRTAQEWQKTAEEKHLQLKVSLPSNPIRLQSDPLLLGIVLQNLFINSFKYNRDSHPISLTATVDKQYMEISVGDSGLGIPTEEQKRIFQKFFRGRNVRMVDTDGTGLGLYMSKTIVENLGGTITFNSEEGKGSEFTVRLPM